MKETKVYVVKHPQGAYEDYQEPIVKVFLNEKEAKSYVKEENAKLPLEQAKKCDECYFKWTCVGQKGKKKYQVVSMVINIIIVRTTLSIMIYKNCL